jgi:hypothetical protein
MIILRFLRISLPQPVTGARVPGISPTLNDPAAQTVVE